MLPMKKRLTKNAPNRWHALVEGMQNYEVSVNYLRKDDKTASLNRLPENSVPVSNTIQVIH